MSPCDAPATPGSSGIAKRTATAGSHRRGEAIAGSRQRWRSVEGRGSDVGAGREERRRRGVCGQDGSPVKIPCKQRCEGRHTCRLPSPTDAVLRPPRHDKAKRIPYSSPTLVTKPVYRRPVPRSDLKRTSSPSLAPKHARALGVCGRVRTSREGRGPGGQRQLPAGGRRRWERLQGRRGRRSPS